MSGLVVPGNIKSIQAVALTVVSSSFGATTAIASVNPAKTVIISRGIQTQVTETKVTDAMTGRWNLDNATTIAYSRAAGVTTDLNVNYYAYVVEYY